MTERRPARVVCLIFVFIKHSYNEVSIIIIRRVGSGKFVPVHFHTDVVESTVDARNKQGTVILQFSCPDSTTEINTNSNPNSE